MNKPQTNVIGYLPPSAPKAIAVLLALLHIACSCARADGRTAWPQFRGPNGQGISASAHPPVVFSKASAAWSVEVPPGHSSPAVLGDKIFLTAFEAKKLDCRAYDRTTGKLLWAKPVAAEKIEETHAFSNPAAATPAADADHVVFYIGSYGLLAYTHDGQLSWERKLAGFPVTWEPASPPGPMRASAAYRAGPGAPARPRPPARRIPNMIIQSAE